ncbi:peptide transport system ATP-binding protein SapD [Striga asiatica]|uniref:Peptide transport system ATP-binding protein SapD n=1 Tax=Striga asiatica TaxID=4170 RepID=A0A5A7PZV4_STRAF|nr:peptide transport system ATP-binding protein SapD [Striga asiatica]
MAESKAFKVSANQPTLASTHQYSIICRKGCVITTRVYYLLFVGFICLKHIMLIKAGVSNPLMGTLCFLIVSNCAYQRSSTVIFAISHVIVIVTSKVKHTIVLFLQKLVSFSISKQIKFIFNYSIVQAIVWAIRLLGYGVDNRL